MRSWWPEIKRGSLVSLRASSTIAFYLPDLTILVILANFPSLLFEIACWVVMLNGVSCLTCLLFVQYRSVLLNLPILWCSLKLGLYLEYLVASKCMFHLWAGWWSQYSFTVFGSVLILTRLLFGHWPHSFCWLICSIGWFALLADFTDLLLAEFPYPMALVSLAFVWTLI
jgi:hypothetical protein